MTTRLRSAPLIGIGSVLAALLAWVGYSLLVTHQEREVAVPRDDASPETVVSAFADALNAHDCETASQLVTNGAKDIAKTWCNSVAELRDFRTRKAFREEPQWSGHDASQQVKSVSVQFDLKWRWLRSDGSMPEGPTTWGYLLVRASDDTPWRISGQGVG